MQQPSCQMREGECCRKGHCVDGAPFGNRAALTRALLHASRSGTPAMVALRKKLRAVLAGSSLFSTATARSAGGCATKPTGTSLAHGTVMLACRELLERSGNERSCGQSKRASKGR